jgi:hypothetical protein
VLRENDQDNVLSAIRGAEVLADLTAERRSSARLGSGAAWQRLRRADERVVAPLRRASSSSATSPIG